MTSMVATIIQAVSPLSGVGATSAAAGAASCAQAGSAANSARPTAPAPAAILFANVIISPFVITEPPRRRSEEHTSELHSLMRISYAVFCLKQKKKATKQ